ncbi:hypothetical protein FB157_120179 [Streptomyces sp. BK340]|nr:hypothetical protein FB157_120179 [Streptomyces sp. BK340]
MRKTLTTAVSLVALLTTLTACSSNSPSQHSSDGKASTLVSMPITADCAFRRVSAAVSSARGPGFVTAAIDPNHLLGRPHQYTSKVTFDDSRVPADQIRGMDKGDVGRGGAIEVFGSPADANARARYIQAVLKSMPPLAEYDYVHGRVLVRVSHYLTPKQAAAYKTAAGELD